MRPSFLLPFSQVTRGHMNGCSWHFSEVALRELGGRSRFQSGLWDASAAGNRFHQDRCCPCWRKRANEEKPNLSAIKTSDIVALASPDVVPISAAATWTSEIPDLQCATSDGAGDAANR
jgi:hypothetical protein